MYDVIMKAFGQTVYMVIGSTIFSRDFRFYPGHRAYSDSTGRPAA